MINTTLKLLLRCKRLYDAKTDIQGILKTIQRRETLKEELDFAKSLTISLDMIRKNYRLMLMLSEKTYGKIKRLQEEVKILRRPFVFRGFDY